LDLVILIPVILGTVQIILLGMLFFRAKDRNGMDSQMERSVERTEKLIRDEGERSRSAFDQKEQQSRMELAKTLEGLGQSVSDKLMKMSGQIVEMDRANRQSLIESLRSFEGQFSENVKAFNQLQREKFGDLSVKQEQMMNTTERRLDSVREVMETKIRELQQQNDAKLEEMRKTVDEKLHQTLETRLGESFKQVSDRLEQVHKGLGEMQTLAAGVGDLKKVLSNVKTRGVLGEYQLENLLEQFLAPNQYEKNVATRPNSRERVEFAIRMPGNDETRSDLRLPIDAKFPTEDYLKLIEAYEQGNLPAIDQSKKQLMANIKKFAKDISEKYVEPPYTTDFGLLYLPFEGLYAEVLRMGMFEIIQREYRVSIVGPTTISAFLNSLQMGFRTLAIQKRTSEVWELLGAVKTEFGKFGDVLEKTKKKLAEAGNVIEQAEVRSRAIERRLRDVQQLPNGETGRVLEGSEELSEDR